MRPIQFGRLPHGVAVAGLLLASLLSGCRPQVSAPQAVSVPTSDVMVAAPASSETAVSVTAAKPAVSPEGAPGEAVYVASVSDEPADLVEAHLAAGEFGNAVAVADAVEDDALRAELLGRIAAVEAEAGEFEAAGLILNRFPELREEEKTVASNAKPSFAGGAGGLMEIMQMIQFGTGGPDAWDVDGSGIGQPAPIPYGLMSGNLGGISVDPLGRLTLLTKAEQSSRLRDLFGAARVADLNSDMAAKSDLRVVSLTRLEKAVAERLRRGEVVPTSMHQLAGLTRVQYVFLDETTNEILLAGPAEAWRYDEKGTAVGVETGHPTLQLDDLVTLLRTFDAGGNHAFQCSIDPRPEGTQAVQEYAAKSAARGPLSAGAGVRSFARRLGELLGEQDVMVNGVPVDSRVARVIVEADYRMKLIGIDKLDAAGIPSFFDLLTVDPASGPVATKALRWWLTVNYDAVMHSEEKTAFEFVGPAVKCLSEDEFFNAQGERVTTGTAETANRRFAEQFTAKYEELAAGDTIFADLRNVFDLSLAAAIIRAEGLDQRAGWDRGVFAAGGEYETAPYMPAETVETVVNHRVYNGTEIVVQVAGGVRGDLMSVLKDSSIYRTAIRAGEAVAAVQAAETPEARWWWDAK